MRLFWLTAAFWAVLETAGLACPACSVSNPQNDSVRTFWVLSAMGILPILLALAVGFLIRRVEKYGHSENT